MLIVCSGQISPEVKAFFRYACQNRDDIFNRRAVGDRESPSSTLSTPRQVRKDTRRVRHRSQSCSDLQRRMEHEGASVGTSNGTEGLDEPSKLKSNAKEDMVEAEERTEGTLRAR